MNLRRCLLPLWSVTLLAQAGPSVPERLRAEAFRTHGAYEDLVWLCDRIGPRLSGSPQLDRAIAWAQARLRAAGLVNVHAEPVMVPHWERGKEWAELRLEAELPRRPLRRGPDSRHDNQGNDSNLTPKDPGSGH